MSNDDIMGSAGATPASYSQSPQPSEQRRTAAGRALLTILRHRAQVAPTEPCMAALIGAVDDAVRMLPKIEAEAAAPDAVASPRFGWAFGQVMKQHPKADAVLVNNILRSAFEAVATPLAELNQDAPQAPAVKHETQDAVASPPPLDVERLKRAVHIVTDNEEYHLEYTSEGFRLAKDVAAEYARLEGQPVAEEPT